VLVRTIGEVEPIYVRMTASATDYDVLLRNTRKV